MQLFPEKEDLIRWALVEVCKKENCEMESSTSWDEALLSLEQRFPKTLEETAAGIRNKYNSYIESAVMKYPKTVNVYWQEYRRNQSKASLPIFPLVGMNDEENDKRLEDAYKTIVKIMADCGAPFGDRKKIPLDVEPNYQCVGSEMNTSLGVRVYSFLGEGAKDTVWTLWDFRSQKVPKFGNLNNVFL